MMFIIMPELPEVETLRRELAKVLVGQMIKSVKILWPKSVAPKDFAGKLKGAKIRGVGRRAKILLLKLADRQTLAIHLKMTGQLVYQGLTLKPAKVKPLIIGGHPESLPQGLSLEPAKDSPFNHTRVIFNFTDGSQLYFNDLRKFGWLKLLSGDSKKVLLARLGREPLSPDFTIQKFSAILHRYPRRKLKALLLDQTLIVGLGNIYVDESCFVARLRPARHLQTLTNLEIKKLYRAIKRVLKLAIAKGGTSTRNYFRSDGRPGSFVPYLKVYGRAGTPCKVCRTPIIKIKLAGRGTHFCPRCQK